MLSHRVQKISTRVRRWLTELSPQHRLLVFAVVGLTVVAFGRSGWWVAEHARKIERLREGVGDTMFFTADGRPWFSMDDRRQDVPLAAISPHLQRAVIAIEDRRFAGHNGIDLRGIARAMLHNLRRLRAAEGASTITQQLARTLFLSNERTVTRKLKEAALAVMLEARLSKSQILELYLNRVYFGAGVYGAERISRALFGKAARDLTLREAALVAALVRAPSALSPWSNGDGAARRARLVLRAMREHAFITPSEERAALRSRPRIRPRPPTAIAQTEGYARHFVRELFEKSFDSDNRPDWQVRTTFVRPLQAIAERAVTRGVRATGRGDLQALVAMDVHTGDVLALVGGRDFRTSPFNRAIESRRQPGSAFKPFVYATALEAGWSPLAVLTGLSRLRVAGQEEWVPRNADLRSPDRLTIRDALVESNNRAAVALQQAVGSGPILQMAAAMGLAGLPDVPSLALGVGEVSLLELTAAYAGFPNGGFRVTPRAIVQVIDDGRRVVERHDAVRTRVLSDASAFQMVTMLQDVLDRGTGTAARNLGVRFPAAGKTGTTDDFKDAWFVGFSSSIAVGVWVGLDQPASIGADGYGARYALPIWSEFMREAAGVVRMESFQMPDSLQERRLCRVSHLVANAGCPGYTEYFKSGDIIPADMCPHHSGQPRHDINVDRLFAGLGRRIASLFGR